MTPPWENTPAAPSVSATARLKAMPATKTNSGLGSALRSLSVARLQRAVRLGIRSLWLHRLRSLLTVLGIVFGVCSVIAMLAIGEGASYEAQEQIKSLGSQNIILTSVKPVSYTHLRAHETRHDLV